jgi:16S rRNA (adenine1518-N6/adenine1519-N6)-dimethyltransferase
MIESSHQARKRFGQNFLHDPQVIARIIRTINPQPGQTLVEIGPGLGALTVPLLEKAGRLQVVEIDRDLIPRLRAICEDAPGLTITQADALDIDYHRFVEDGGKLRLIGNLPYNISTPLLFHLLTQADAIIDMHFMLQKEVVERMCAAAGDEAYGRLTVALAARCEVAHLFDVGPGAFNPPPKIDSAVVRLRPRAPDFVIDDLARFDRLVAQAFSQRRKTLSNALKGLCDAGQIRAAGIDPGIRAERLHPRDFARLANRLAPA